MIEYKTGDVFRAQQQILIHGCNCYCTMGAGVARLVAYYYPLAESADKKTGRADPSKLGKYTFSEQPHYFFSDKTLIVINAYTQYGYGRPYGSPPVDYDAIETVMKSINQDFPRKSIAMPKVGAGLAGGDWNTIAAIINKVFKRKITVYSL